LTSACTPSLRFAGDFFYGKRNAALRGRGNGRASVDAEGFGGHTPPFNAIVYGRGTTAFQTARWAGVGCVEDALRDLAAYQKSIQDCMGR
jgi:hypothetical protein